MKNKTSERKSSLKIMERNMCFGRCTVLEKEIWSPQRDISASSKGSPEAWEPLPVIHAAQPHLAVLRASPVCAKGGVAPLV